MVTEKGCLNDDCVLCGGLAMRLYGSPRFTIMDTDVSYRLDEFHEIELVQALTIEDEVEDLDIGLSVGAAYGILTLVFQDGHGEKALDFTSVGGITPWLPLFLFVVLFGLPMDYHVFVLSRIRELVDRGMSTDNAVAEGIKSTAGVITGAAAVMVVTFGAFATGSDQGMKQLGIGLAAQVRA